MNNQLNGRWITIIGLIIITANIILMAYLWSSQHQSHMSSGNRPPVADGQAFDYLNQELKLDSIQREHYRVMRDQHRAAAGPLTDSIRKMKDSFFGMLAQGNITDSVVRNKANEIAGVEAQLDLVTFKHFQQLRAICKPGQQQKFDSIIQQVLHNMGGPRRQGPPPQRPGARPGHMPPPEGQGPPPPGEE